MRGTACTHAAPLLCLHPSALHPLLTVPRLPPRVQPHQLAGAGVNPDKLGVAAALWDGALVLAGYLAAQPHYQYLGG